MSLKPSINSSKPNGTVRESSIELLRILVMCGVVLLHYNGYAGQALTLVTPGSWNHTLLLGLQGLFICAVNLFVLITGYFSCTTQRRTASKAFGLILQVIVFNAVFYLLQAIANHNFSVTAFVRNLLPTNYFVILYVALYIISPYLNLLLQSLDRNQLKRLVIVALVLFSAYPTLVDILAFLAKNELTGLNSVSAYGDDSGYTIVNFLLMYLLGAYLRITDIRIPKRYSGAAVAVLAVILAFTGKLNGGIAWSYCNPLVIAQAVAMFLFFRQISFHSKIVNELAGSAFTCFLFHPFLLYRVHVAQAVTRSPLYLIAHITICCVSIYLVSWVVYKIYDFVITPVIKLADKVFTKLKIDFSL